MNPAADSLLRPRPSGLLPFVLGSLVGHLLVVAVALTLSWVWAAPRLDLTPVPIKASLVRKGTPRDPNLLPTKPEPPAPVAPQPAQVKPPDPVAPPAAAAPTPVKVASRDAKAEPAKDPRKSLFEAINRTTRAAREAEGAADGDADGTSTTQEGERYFALLESVVHKNYDVSDTIPEAERRTLKAQVSLRIGAGGEVLDVRVTAGSGNPTFDAAVLAAVKKASPFTPPPLHLREGLKKDGVGFVFRAAQ